jgi:hypothetical protein
MRTQRRFHLLMLLLSTVLLALPLLAVSAASNRVEHFTISIDDAFVVPAAADGGPCEFELIWAAAGTVKISVHYDKDGNFVKRIETFPNTSYIFSANGNSIDTVSSSSLRISPNPDGTFTVAESGLAGHIIVPGEGLYQMNNDVGHIVRIYDPATDTYEVVSVSAQYNETGDPFDGPFPALCTILA